MNHAPPLSASLPLSLSLALSRSLTQQVFQLKHVTRLSMELQVRKGPEKALKVLKSCLDEGRTLSNNGWRCIESRHVYWSAKYLRMSSTRVDSV